MTGSVGRMSDVVDEPVPTCPTCGEEMRPWIPPRDEAPDLSVDGQLVVPAGWRCENVNCPTVDSDLAPASQHQSAMSPRDAREQANEPTGADDIGG